MSKNNTQKGRKKNLPDLIVPKSIEVLVCSMGGVGSTFLINHISKYKVTNKPNDKDGLKHILMPPFSFNSNVKYVFVYGNPIESVISLFARSYHNRHSKKLLDLDRKIAPINKNITLREYARQKVDRFKFERQFFNWLNYSDFYPTLFLKYEDIWDNVEKIHDFLEISQEEVNFFPKKKKRDSKFSNLQEKTKNDLEEIYGDFEKYINEFGDFKIINNRKKALFPKVFISKPFYILFGRSVLRFINRICPDFFEYLFNLFYSKRK